MRMYENWRNSLKNKEVFTLSKYEDLKLLLTRDKPGDPYGRLPVFHVWKGDKWLYCGPSQETAERIYAANK